MKRRDVITILGEVLVAAVWPHIARAQQVEHLALPTPALVRSLFTLGGWSFAINLPGAARVSHPNGQGVVFNLAKGGRLQRTVEFRAGVQRADGPRYPTVVLPNGGRFAYEMNDNTGGGSGGPIAELTGHLEFGSLTISVTCTDQNEVGREPAWCVPYLGNLEVLARSP